MTLQWILVYRQPARTRVVLNFAIGGTSRPEGRGMRVGGVTFWTCHINGGGNFNTHFRAGVNFPYAWIAWKSPTPLTASLSDRTKESVACVQTSPNKGNRRCLHAGKRISSLLFLLLGLTQRGTCAAVTSTPITDARTWLLLLCDLFYPSGDV